VEKDMANGYVGKILWVDLSEGTLREEELDEDLCRRYLGGYGLGVRTLFDRQKPGVDPLGPDNILGFLTGTLTGTSALGGSRFAVVGKSPLTGTWGDANSGGNFGPFMRFAGYDAVFFTGISKKPVYLLLADGAAELRDAGHLWGKDTHDTEDILREELGKDVEVASIGPSGEKLSLISGVMTDKGRAAARSGLGAVMGSKKLKAVVAKGSAAVPVFDAAKVAELRKTYSRELRGLVDEFRNFGTVAVIVPFAKIGDTPVKNWNGVTEIDFPGIEKIGVDAVMERVQRKYACHRCVVACGGLMKESAGEYEYEYGVHKPEYETVSMFGTNCLNDNLGSIIKANDVCNRLGLDTISAGATIAFAIECYENGIISKEDTGGIEMTWGNHRSIIAMLEALGERQGFGDVLADGVKIAAEKIGKGAEAFAVHIHGQEPPAHNPKFEYGFASCYHMDATPARHMRWHGAFVPPGLPVPSYEPGQWSGRGEAQRMNVIFNNALECLGVCVFVIGMYPHVDALLEFINAVTGWDMTLDELCAAGERVANLRQAFNLREGLNPLDWPVCGRLVGKPPLTEGPLAGVTIDQEAVNREFLEAMDWDLKTMMPSEEKLLELGLDDVAELLRPGGVNTR
jgi:aldehyde:ferredoxin oxidoreductase